MRFLFWFLLLAVAAVVAALAARLNAGYALLVAPPYRIELSLNLLLVLIVGGFAALEAYLSRPETQARSLAVPRLTLSAEIALEQGQPQEALRILEALKREAGMHTAALRLELRASQAARRFAAIPPLVEQLVKRGVFDAAQGDQVRIAAQREQLRALAHDAAGLRDAWNRLPESTRMLPPIARAAALSFLQLGGDREAVEIVARGLEREWDSELVELYGECRVPDATRQIEQAEHWLAAHNQDAALLRVLGTLCQRQQLWGKAQTYLEASVALDDHWRTHLALGEMLGRLGRSDEANTHFVAALRLATDELKQR